jgi:hypothetical protein
MNKGNSVMTKLRNWAAISGECLVLRLWQVAIAKEMESLSNMGDKQGQNGGIASLHQKR